MNSTTCTWTEEDDGYEGTGNWAGECGVLFMLNDGATPKENNMKFCCGCGKPLTEVPYVPEVSE